MNHSDRRSFLRNSFITAGALAVASRSVGGVAAATCSRTPPQAEGPFYPGEALFHPQNDLTRVPGHTQRAAGQVIHVQGKVVDTNCRPLSDVNVEIWQACASGRYNNPKDTNPAPLDPHFRYWGETFTDAQGAYSFTSIQPGAYPAGDGWIRPPHIHFKVSRLGFRELTTQLYFKGSPYNDTDLILQRVPAQERNSVIIDFKPRPGLQGELEGIFDITLLPVRT